MFGAYDGDADGRLLLRHSRASSPAAQPYLHSHMLGVLPEYRDTGVGRRAEAARSGKSARRAASS